MSGHFNSRGNTAFLKVKFDQNLSAGEKLSGAEFEMTIDQYPEISVLIRSTQIGAMGRSDVEDFGPMGMKFVQHGPLENSGEIACTAVETIAGPVLRMLQKVVKNKEYLDITIRATPESTAGISAEGAAHRYEHCKLRSDVIDLSTEDQAALVKPPFTIVYNWKDF
ncbi:baseplate protein (plasmid) [Photobacterium sp. CCB-ST2H9]|uniref:baseplate protein n=1 Tax=Photobacterium sp. CCB-ST2H9 TaxID=2912855 RepID=UPI00200347A3|nr:baseplate protein [Photobacterium sp. CCB-ST2H9]UTM60414.1 baseplate protein [Photobacterium sp. CCB-ST2H9]